MLSDQMQYSLWSDGSRESSSKACGQVIDGYPQQPEQAEFKCA
jgi:hypothetical protein